MALEQREKKLASVMVVLVLVMAALLGVSKFNSDMAKIRGKIKKLKVEAEIAKQSQTEHYDLEEDKLWLDEHDPEVMEYEDMQEALYKHVKGSARARGLSIFGERPRTIEDEGGYYLRAEFMCSVTASEEVLYDWLVMLHQPEKSIALVDVRIGPKSGGLVTCTLVVEKWMTPPSEFED